jgi:hypothetical protein
MSTTLEKGLDNAEGLDKFVEETKERQRDASGRFAPKESAKLTAPAPAPVPGDAKAALPQPQQTPAPAAGDIPVPASWAPELQAEWGKLAAPVKQYMVKRESELQNGFQTIHQRVEVSKAILSEFVPYAETLEKEGATPVTAIRTLLQTAHALRSGGAEFKKAILLSLAQQYGVDIGQPLNVELAQAQAQAGNLQIDRMYQMSGQVTQQQADAARALNAFASDPANKHFQSVRQIMGQIISMNPNTGLKEAYDTAIWAHPEVRKSLLAEQQAQYAEEQRRKSAANLSVTGAPGGPTMVPSKPGHTGLRDTIEAAFGNSQGERV